MRLGPTPGEAGRALIMVHGRGATAESIASLVPVLKAEPLAVLAPQAAGNTWYPHSFLSPVPQNEPGMTSGITLLASLVRQLEADGVPAARIALLGFSQGACLSLEFAARHARRYGAVIGFSGGLIGPPGTPRDYTGSLDGTPVFLGCSDVDAHIPAERVRETQEVLSKMGAKVDMRLYPGMPHTVNEDEIAAASDLLATL
ncbi:MAG: alpha/beta hydrolase [Gemmatimonadaceae bacterium]